MKSNLLIQEPPLQVLPSLAVALGLNGAIVVQQVHYWLQNPKAGVVRDGFKWVHNTYDEWQEGNFPFWSIPTIQRAFTNMENKKVLISAQFDAQDRDMRKYYRIDYEALEHINLIPSKTSNSEDVNRNTESLSESDRFKAVISKLEGINGSLNGMTADYVNGWLKNHEDKYIFNAIAVTVANKVTRAGFVKYTDEILLGWETHGYPLPREDRVKAGQSAANKNQSILDEYSKNGA